jgi:hypothetical protein
MTRRRKKNPAGLKAVPKAVAQMPLPVRDPARDPATSIIEFLEDFIISVREGRITPDSLLFFWMENKGNGQVLPRMWRHDVSISQQIAYGVLAQEMGIREWRGDEE